MKISQSFARSAILVLPLLLFSCNPSPPCQDCDSEDVADRGEDQDQGQGEDAGVMPDLPCNGADLRTDDLNCGACGNECNVIWPGTEYAAGGCVDSACGPIWTALFTLLPPPETLTCQEICGLGDRQCAPRGCSGLTGYVCVSVGDFGTQCDLGDPLNTPRLEMYGECDEPAPYPNNVEPGDFVYLNCCCERP
jgi:hypothetical protein